MAAISGNWSDHYIFWFGPYLGAIAAALVYNYLFLHEDAAKEAEEEARAAELAHAAPATAFKAQPEALPVAALPVPSTPSQEWR